MINAKIIADSKNTYGDRITTMLITFPRFILAELNTHRMFSRNSASSRAIPFEKMVKSVEENPFIPIAWQKNHKGMQGNEYFTEEDDIQNITGEYMQSVIYAIERAKVLAGCGVTKQLANRLLEPFMWHKVLITGTEWENFFSLRCPQYGHSPTGKFFKSKKEAINFDNHFTGLSELEWLKLNKGQSEIHMMALAEAMWDAYQESVPKQLKANEWHIPFGDDIDIESLLQSHIEQHPSDSYRAIELEQEFKTKIATARCARISYTTIESEKIKDDLVMAMAMLLSATQLEKDIELHDRLLASKHLSPFEHCARAMDKQEYENLITTTYDVKNDVARIVKGTLANFKGFIAYRHIIKANM